jgi:hypothetical protein
MKTKLKSGKTFRSIAAVGFASVCLMFTSCEKEASVLNPEQGVNSASSNPSSALVTEFDAKMQEQLSLLPLGEKLVEIAQDEIETSLNTVFSKMEGDFSEIKTSSFISQVQVNNGHIAFSDEQAWLLESATQITNIVLQNANEQVFGIDVIIKKVETSAVFIETVLYTIKRNNPQPILPNEYCIVNNDYTYQEAAVFFQRYTNYCLMNPWEIGSTVDRVINFDYSYEKAADRVYYEPNDDLFYINHPNNDGEFRPDVSGNVNALSAKRWNEYRLSLESFYNQRIIDLGPIGANKHWEVVAHLVVDPFTNIYPQGVQGVAHHHRFIGSFILVNNAS